MRNLTQKEMELYLLYFKSIALLEHGYECLLLGAINNIEAACALNERVDVNHVIAAMSAVTTVIDALARTLKISRKLSGLNQKGDDFHRYIESQDWVVEARNKVQHINEEVRKGNTGPILGSLVWCTDNHHYMLSLTTPFPGEQIPGLVIDTVANKTIMDMAYVYNDRYLNVPRAYSGAKIFSDFIKSKLIFKDDGGNVLDVPVNYLFVKMEFDLQTAARE